MAQQQVQTPCKPELPQGYLGPQSKFEEFGLSTVTHNSPEIRCHFSRLEIKFKTTKPTKITASLIDTATDKEYRDLIFTQTVNELVTLVINFPGAGFYKLQVYGLLATDKSMSLPNVYNYLIQNTVPPTGAVTAFPKQFAQWKDGCYLFEPFSFKGLDSSPIKVIVPGAKAVALTVDNEWFPLKQRAPQNENDKIRPWHGNIEGLQKFKEKTKKVALAANFSEDDETKYTSLLEFEI